MLLEINVKSPEFMSKIFCVIGRMVSGSDSLWLQCNQYTRADKNTAV